MGVWHDPTISLRNACNLGAFFFSSNFTAERTEAHIVVCQELVHGHSTQGQGDPELQSHVCTLQIWATDALLCGSEIKIFLFQHFESESVFFTWMPSRSLPTVLPFIIFVLLILPVFSTNIYGGPLVWRGYCKDGG